MPDIPLPAELSHENNVTVTLGFLIIILLLQIIMTQIYLQFSKHA